LTKDQVANTPFFDEGLGTENDTEEQNFDPTHLANNYNKQFPRLIHMQNSNDDPNDQIYNHDDLQDEPHSSIRATFWTSDSSLNDSQSTKRDTQRIMTKAQIHTFPKKLPSNKQKFQQRAKTEVLDDASTSSNSNLFRYSETQKIANDTCRSHDNREIVMAKLLAPLTLNMMTFSKTQTMTFRNSCYRLYQTKARFNFHLMHKPQLSTRKMTVEMFTTLSRTTFHQMLISLMISQYHLRDNELESDVEDRPHTKVNHSYHSNETMY